MLGLRLHVRMFHYLGGQNSDDFVPHKASPFIATTSWTTTPQSIRRFGHNPMFHQNSRSILGSGAGSLTDSASNPSRVKEDIGTIVRIVRGCHIVTDLEEQLRPPVVFQRAYWNAVSEHIPSVCRSSYIPIQPPNDTSSLRHCSPVSLKKKPR